MRFNLPINYSLFFLFLIIFSELFSLSNVIVLDVIGDSYTPGRIIEDRFERGLIFSCAERIKKSIEQKIAGITVIIPTFSGERISQQKRAHRLNSIEPLLVVSLAAFFEEYGPSITIYQYTTQSLFDMRLQKGLAFYSYEQAYKFSYFVNQQLIRSLHAFFLKKEYASLFISKGFHAIPITLLRGVMSPAFFCEFGLSKKDDWELFFEPIAAYIAYQAIDIVLNSDRVL